MRSPKTRGPLPHAAWPSLVAFASICGMTYVVGVLLVAIYPGGVPGFDRPGMELAMDIRSDGLRTFAQALTTVGDAGVVAIALGLLAIGAALRRSRSWAAFSSLALVGALGIHTAVKPLVGRMRPDLDPIVEVAGKSFPSGHASAAAVLCGVLAVAVLVAWGPRLAIVALVLGSLVAIGVGLTRVYLGVHWPSDVLAGLASGASWSYFAARITVLPGMG